MQTLILTVGLPRSGKTTWSKASGFPVVNPDSIRLSIHGQNFYSDAEDLVWYFTKVMINSLFIAGHNTVVLDATNTTKERRDKWSRKYNVRFKVFNTNFEACQLRAVESNRPDLIPVIEKMNNKFEPLTSEELKLEI